MSTMAKDRDPNNRTIKDANNFIFSSSKMHNPM
jgi:hypothetical protein